MQVKEGKNDAWPIRLPLTLPLAPLSCVVVRPAGRGEQGLVVPVGDTVPLPVPVRVDP